ncbi:NeuD/PglB/VioB family sugar acetyltransferase [Cellulophaga sp. F20128]|uniref:NeuD/PglB/VioB family sugar acetyltransferase n=1 Tax=Cellulophaga sp. F20128 TaxID=2926413 RepID=UPI001FF5B6EF|nr:NeuD/PglB/VioB family sugar acetyltransferase [Cellulophaga sp. F20128]MCK0156859.1 NeuD/PglB/VioB family sugar acetyltransferase [Cellulophaga sp. F20128]
MDRISKIKVRLYGAGGHAHVIVDALKSNDFEVSEIFDDDPKNGLIASLKVEKIAANYENFQFKGSPMIIAIGNNKVRKKIANQLDVEYITVTHKKSAVATNTTIGNGTVIFAGAIIQPNTKIGKHVIINSGASVDHDNIIEDFAHISPQVTLCGEVTIKEGAFIGANSVIIPKVTIGKWATVGAGSVVLENVPDYATVVGNPSRIITKKTKTKAYHLFVKKLKSLEDINSYKKLLNQYWTNNVYYTYEYLKYYENPTDKLRYFLLTEEGIPVAIMPFYIRKITDSEHYKDVITPYGYGGPLCIDCNNSSVLPKFWEQVDQWYHKNNIISEFVRFNLDGNHKDYTGSLTETLINIKGAIKENNEAQWIAFSTKVRNNYRKAEKYNLSFRLFEGKNITDEIITEFHDVYIETMERNNAKDIYFFSKQYFESIIYSNPDNFAIAVSYKENIAVSVELIIINATTLYAFLGGTRAKYFECRPNDFLRVEILKWAVTNKMKFYVLGGGQQNNDGLYKSKKMFFPKDEDVIFYTGRKIINKEVYNLLSEIAPTTDESIEAHDYFPAYRKL